MRYCDLDCFNCRFPDCSCPDAQCIKGLHVEKYIELEENREIDEEKARARREYQKAWRAAHADRVKAYNEKYKRRK